MAKNGVSKSSSPEIDRILAKETSNKQVKVFVTTWNVGNAEPKGFEQVFKQPNANHLDEFEIFAIGLQESTYAVSGGTSLIGLNGVHESITHFSQQVLPDIFPESQFFLVEHCVRAQLQLYVFAKVSLRSRISNVEKSVENTGFLHVFPNKGGLLVTLAVDGTKLAFISCHLTAHEGKEYCEQRNQSIVEILGGVRAGDKDIDITEQFHHVFWMGDMNYRLTLSTDTPANGKKNISAYRRHHNSLQLTTSSATAEDVQIDLKDEGDNGGNSRALVAKGNVKDPAQPIVDDDDSDEDDDDPLISKDNNKENAKKDKKAEWRKDRETFVNMLLEENWAEMMKYDELNREIAAKRVLNGFEALTPNFPPTFKRIRDMVLTPNKTRKYDLKNGDFKVNDYYHHKRIPSYTDRILFKSSRTYQGDVVPLFFESVEGVASSDHKPVFAGFNVNIYQGCNDIYLDNKVISSTGATMRRVEKYLKLTLLNMKGENLEEMDSAMFGGLSDPYFKVTTDPPNLLMKDNKVKLGYYIQSKTITRTVNPDWSDESHLLNFSSLDLKGLAQNASLIIQVWDWDRSNEDDLIGVVTIPLRDILKDLLAPQSAHGSPKPVYKIEEYLYCNSEVMGRITGDIIVDASSGGNSDMKHILEVYNDRQSDQKNLVTLTEAVDYIQQQKAGTCSCTIN